MTDISRKISAVDGSLFLRGKIVQGDDDTEHLATHGNR